MEVNNQVHIPFSLHRDKKPSVLTEWISFGAPVMVWTFRRRGKILLLQVTEAGIVQHIVGYTD
jgi:hypothetical protein